MTITKKRSKKTNRVSNKYMFEQKTAPVLIEDILPRLQSFGKHSALGIKIDIPLLIVVITLIIFGLIILYSASYDISFRFFQDSSIFFIRQVRTLLLGSLAAILMTFFDYRKLPRYIVYLMATTLLSLLVLLVLKGAGGEITRGLFQGSVQPSELAKLVIIIYLAVWLHSKRESLKEIQFGLLPLGIILSVFCVLILLQPDISVVVTILIMGGLMFFLAGGDLKQIFILLMFVVVFGGIILKLFSYSATRVEEYISGIKNPIQAPYQVLRSFDAFVKGGWFGVGIGKGETKLTEFPVPHTDSIFAVIGEETGVFGAAIVVFLFALLLWRGMVIAHRAPDELGSLIAAGLSIWISLEAFINMAVMVNLLPFAGNALPFISYGGSSLFVSLVAVGILLNISYQGAEKSEGKDLHAVVDLRRRDGGRRVSSARRSTSREK